MVLDVLLVAVLTALPQLPSEPNRASSLDGIWDFSLFNSNAVRVAEGPIDVPSSWELRGYGKPRYDADISGEVGVYRRRFTVPRDWAANDRIYLRFDGVQFGAEVCLNGQVVGDFTTSFNAVVLEVTDVVRRLGENELVVRTHGHPKGAAFDTNDDWTLHGIHRSVTLFALPPRYIVNWRLVTKVKGADAAVSVSVETSEAMPATVELLDANGERVGGGEGRSVEFVVENAKLWTAETPALHTLVLRIPGQEIRRRVGLREVAWTDGVLKLNGRPIELRGVNHHDLSPVNGRAMTAEEQRRDVELIIAANCNFIRTSHYPPSEALLDACDELGVYVMDEVPFGGGKKLVEDASYGPSLLERARLTVERDANRASVIAWSVGNEQKVSPITLAAEREVKRLDPTRPTCFPQQPNYFEKHVNERGMAEQGDILNWHYPLVIAPEGKLAGEWFPKFDRPFVSGEFAHANGRQLGHLESYMKLIRSCPSYAGGAVWMFQDQGLLRNAADMAEEERTGCVWLDDRRVYDSHRREGTDGIVFADRTPQTDYYELRGAYAPLVLGDEIIGRPAGRRLRLSLPVENRYDFLPLDEAVVGSWQVQSPNGVLASGALAVPPVPARGLGQLGLESELTTDIPSVCWLEVAFRSRRSERLVIRRTYPLNVDLTSLNAVADVKPTRRGDGVRTKIYTFAFDSATGRVRMADAAGRALIDGPVRMRVDRREMLAKDFSVKALELPHWEPKVLTPDTWTVRTFTDEKLELEVVFAPTNAAAVRAGARLGGLVTFAFQADRIVVSFDLSQNCARKVFETGLAFDFAEGISRVDWIGGGPYESYPGETALATFGVWSLDMRDLYFSGNRRDVRALRLSAADGASAVVLSDGAVTDFAFECADKGIRLGANAIVSRRGCRFAIPYDIREVKAGEPIRGSFVVVPAAATLPVGAVFGLMRPLTPFAPYRKVYDD